MSFNNPRRIMLAPTHFKWFKNRNSFEITRDILQLEISLPSGEILILAILSSRMNKHKRCFPSFQSLADSANCSKKSIGTLY